MAGHTYEVLIERQIRQSITVKVLAETLEDAKTKASTRLERLSPVCENVELGASISLAQDAKQKVLNVARFKKKEG